MLRRRYVIDRSRLENILRNIGAMQHVSMPIWFDLSRQRLAINFLQNDLICRDSDFWYIGAVSKAAVTSLCINIHLCCSWQQFFSTIGFVQTTAKLVCKLKWFVSFCDDTLGMPRCNLKLITLAQVAAINKANSLHLNGNKTSTIKIWGFN